MASAFPSSATSPKRREEFTNGVQLPGQGPTAMQLAAKEGSQKKANLSLVPCKFYRNGACSAGSACPFAHNDPGTPKQICPWYAQSPSACKFGAKCQLAHVLPGQPLMYDRKNKRAQLIAQREADSLHQAELSESPPKQQPHFTILNNTDSPNANPTNPPTNGRRRQTSSGITLAMEAGANGQPKPTGFMPPPSGPLSARVTEAAVAPLGAWSRGLSDAIKSPVPLQQAALSDKPAPSKQYGFEVADVESPARPVQAFGLPLGQPMPIVGNDSMQRSTRKSPDFFDATQINDILSSPRSLESKDELPAHGTPPIPIAAQFQPSQALRSPSSNFNSGPAAFGTSPFSFPGAKASIFLQPSSFGSDDAPISRLGFSPRRPSSSLTTFRRGSIENPVMPEMDQDLEDDDTAESDFLPSSLHDLLEPSEMSKRRNRLNDYAQSVPATNPFAGWSQAQTGGESNSPGKRKENSLLASFTDSILSPHAQQAVTHAPGSSLPLGMAAGMSRLHFKPTAHASTPPSYPNTISGSSPGTASMSGISPTAASFVPQRPPSASRSALGRRTSATGQHPGLAPIGSPLSRNTWSLPDVNPPQNNPLDEDEHLAFQIDL